MFLLKYKFYKIVNCLLIFVGYLDCKFLCNVEFFNIVYLNFLYRYFFYNFKLYFITINVRKEYPESFKKIYFYKKIVLRFLNSKFYIFYIKKINIFYIKLFNIFYNQYIYDHNILNFIFIKSKYIWFFSYFFLYINKYIMTNYNLIFKIQWYFNLLNILYNFLFVIIIQI